MTRVNAVVCFLVVWTRYSVGYAAAELQLPLSFYGQRSHAELTAAKRVADAPQVAEHRVMRIG